MYIKPRIVCLDETEQWLDEALVGAAGRIFGVHIYDANRVTHCCELTGSYELDPLECAIDNILTCPEDIRDQIEETWNMHTEPVCYVHCYTIDGMTTFPLPTQRCKADEYDECWDAIVEHYRCNSPYYELP